MIFLKMTNFNYLELITILANIVALLSQFLLGKKIITVFYQSIMLFLVSFLFLIVGIGYNNKGMIICQIVWFAITIYTMFVNFPRSGEKIPHKTLDI